ncbi:MAG: LysE family translocator [Pseudohongiellaceae bacterium]
MTLIVFILFSILFVIVPGPNVAIIISTTLSQGRAKGLLAVSGTSAAMAIQLLIAAFATNWLLLLLEEQFTFLKWLGVAYLGYIGVKALLDSENEKSSMTISGLLSFQRGFWVSLTNPKTILFFSAFLPQFVTSEQLYLFNILMLSGLFWAIAVCIDSGYVFLADSMAAFIKQTQYAKRLKQLPGVFYLAAAALLGSSHQSD